MNDLAGKHIVLGLTGGIACYKAAELTPGLVKEGATVQVVMTEASEQFITPVTMQALSAARLRLAMGCARANNMPHINLSRQADAILIAPCSADFMARLVQGRSDELLSLLCLARPIEQVPLLIAPAMNREMWAHPATQRNMAQLAADGATILGVGSGFQACGETGDGRMLEPAEMLEDVIAFFQPKLLAGKQGGGHRRPDLRSARPDPRHHQPFLRQDGFRHRPGRARSRRRGHADRRARWPGDAARRARVDVKSARDMLAATAGRSARADVFIATAAVADWRPLTHSEQKIKKDGSGEAPTVAFTENPDILLTVARSERAPKAARCSASASPPRATTC
jgi:phosphopantothenoylcysteine decarboxylase/phosphopantothenate--cysteine ligase